MSYVLTVYTGKNPVRSPYEPKIYKFLGEMEKCLHVQSGNTSSILHKDDLYWQEFETRADAAITLKTMRKIGFLDEIDSLLNHLTMLKEQAKTRLADDIRANPEVWRHE